ncbi:hypothetical protein KAZ66_05495, partial [Candidatus Woesebacteria bacterium]|nr:hypothetical protein [Candidatus Woesebacteria bacterium]
MVKRQKKETITHNFDQTYFFGKEIIGTQNGVFQFAEEKPFAYDRYLSQIILVSPEEMQALQTKGEKATDSIRRILHKNNLLFHTRELSIPKETREFEIWLQVVNHCNLRCMGCATGMD